MSTVGRLIVYGGRIVNLPRYRFVLASTLIVHGGTCGMPLAQRSFPPIPVPKATAANLPSRQKNPTSCPDTSTPPSPNAASSPSATSTSTLIHRRFYIPLHMIVMFFHAMQRIWPRRHGDVPRRRGMSMVGISMSTPLARGIIFQAKLALLMAARQSIGPTHKAKSATPSASNSATPATTASSSQKPKSYPRVKKCSPWLNIWGSLFLKGRRWPLGRGCLLLREWDGCCDFFMSCWLIPSRGCWDCVLLGRVLVY